MDSENELIIKWFPLVRSLASRMTETDMKEDAEQEGMIGLLNAIRNFEDSKGVKFITYATTCIRNSILNFIAKEKTLTDKLIYSDKLEEFLPDSRTQTHQLVENKQVHAKIVEACGELNERELYVLEERMLSDNPESLRKIADKFKVTYGSIKRDEDRLIKQIKDNFGGTL